MTEVLWPGVDLHVVSGKGGAGKTTIAAALAMALAHAGSRTLLMEVEGRQGIAQLFDTPPLPYEERRVAVAPGGGEVWALAVDPQEALIDYLSLYYNLRSAGTALRKLGAIEFATTIAPGLRDVLLTGKACELVRRADKPGADSYDAIVMDAPPTGRIAKFLNVTAEVSGLAHGGPIRKHADLVRNVVASHRTAVHLVTLLEEMPVQETLDGIDDLRAHGLPVGGVFVNMVRPALLPEEHLLRLEQGQVRVDEVLAALREAKVPGRSKQLARLLVDEGVEHAQRVRLENRERERIDALGLPILALPMLTDGIDLGALYELAGLLRAEGVR